MTIFTAMINFQNILKQKGLANGPLWSDEGIYHLAKEIQLLQSDEFNNIFLGIKENNVISTNPFVLLTMCFTCYPVRIIKLFHYL